MPLKIRKQFLHLVLFNNPLNFVLNLLSHALQSSQLRRRVWGFRFRLALFDDALDLIEGGVAGKYRLWDGRVFLFIHDQAGALQASMQESYTLSEGL